jgi:outer membrane receptor for ferrienterochelin and colicins
MSAWLAAALLLAPAPSSPQGDTDDTDPVDDGGPAKTRRTVVVTGTRSARALDETPVATSVISRDDIVDVGAQNLAEVLEEAPGLQLVRGVGGTGLRLQGLDPAYTLVLVDGQRVTGRVNGVVDLSRIPAEDLEQIEIVRGPGSVLWGADALAGTINLRTRSSDRPHAAEAMLAYGSFATMDLTGRAAMARRRWASAITAGLHRTDGWDADPGDATTTGPRIRQWNVATTHELRRMGPFSMRARAEYLRRDAQRIDASDTGAVLDRRNLSETLDVTLTPIFSRGPSELTLSAHASLFRDQFVQDQRDATQLDNYEHTIDALGQFGAVYAHTLGSHTVTAGVDGQLERLIADRVDPGRVDRARYAMFVQDEWVPTTAPRITIVPGARVDVDSFFGAYPTPRLAMAVAPKPWLTLRASFGRGFRAPGFRELFLRFANPSAGYVVRGNPDLRPETSWGTQLSAEITPLRQLAIGVSAFDNRLRDAIVVDTEAGTGADGTSLFRYTNVGEATTRGVESTAVLSLRETLRLEGSYTYLWTFDGENRRALPGRARHAGTAGLRLARARWGTMLRVRASIFGERRFYLDEDGDGVEDPRDSPAFATLDLRASQDLLADHVQIFVGVDNVLDAGDATDNPLVPRSYYGGITLRY